MGLMDSMMVGSAVANGIMELDVGMALWLLLVVGLVASGLGIVAKAHRGRPLDISAPRRPKAAPLAALPGRLCEMGSV